MSNTNPPPLLASSSKKKIRAHGRRRVTMSNWELWKAHSEQLVEFEKIVRESLRPEGFTKVRVVAVGTLKRQVIEVYATKSGGRYCVVFEHPVEIDCIDAWIEKFEHGAWESRGVV